MRRVPLMILLALGLAVPAGAYAFAGDADDGTLSVRHARGAVGLRVTGAIIGHINHGRLSVKDPIIDDGTGPELWGCDHKRDLSDEVPDDVYLTCSGNDIRFRMAGGRYRLFVKGSGIALSVVGHGRVMLDGRGDDDADPDGGYSFNDEPYQSLPADPTLFSLAAPGS